MKKRIMISLIALACICGTTASYAAVADSKTNAEVIARFEKTKAIIDAAFKSSNTVKGFLSPTVTVDDNNDEIYTDLEIFDEKTKTDIDKDKTTESVKPGKDTDEPKAEEPSSNPITKVGAADEEKLQLYNVWINEDDTSIYDKLSNDNTTWIEVSDSSNGVGFGFISIGEDYATAEAEINSMNLPEERKERMRKRAKEIAGKYYVESIRHQTPEENARIFVSDAAIENFIKENDIQCVEDVKRVYVDNKDFMLLLIKTSDKEYLLPYNWKKMDNFLVKDNIHDIEDIKDLIFRRKK